MGEGGHLPVSYTRGGPESPSQVTHTLSPSSEFTGNLTERGEIAALSHRFCDRRIARNGREDVKTNHTSPGVHFSSYRDAAVFWTFLLSPIFHQNKWVLPLSSHNNFITSTKDSKSAVTNRIKWFVCCNIQTFKDAGPSSFDDPGLQLPRSSQSYQAQAARDVSAKFTHMLLFSRSAFLRFHRSSL